jgi:putative nucleotidyltransferase with HDIG domain
MESTGKKHLLFVDDEANILQGLQRMLRMRRDVWDMVFVSGGREALQAMKQKSFDIIITDMKMPEMDGVELLTEVMKQFPETVRFILSGQMNNETLVRIIGPCHLVLKKPCDTEYLIYSIEQALKLRHLLGDSHLRAIISELKSLPSLPALYLQLEEEMRSPMCSVRNVANIISQDLPMSAKLLHIINSPYFGLCSQVTDIAQAVKILGLDTIKSLIFITQIFTSLQGDGPISDCLEGLWRHSLNVSSYSRKMAQMLQLSTYEEDSAFKSGLFHDIGKIILLTRLPEVFIECIHMSEMDGIPLFEAEFRIMGASHAEVGAYLLGLWGFSNPVLEAVLFHHRIAESGCRERNGVPIVHIANILEHRVNVQNSLVSVNQELNIKFLQYLSLYERLSAFHDICVNQEVKRKLY